MTDTTIANNALARVGAERIGDIEDTTKGARLCKALLPTLKEELIESALWGFASKTVTLPRLAETPPHAQAAFQLPNDCVRVGYIDGLPRNRESIKKWRIQGRTLLLLGGFVPNPLNIQYVSKTVPVSDYSPAFRLALEYRLAAEIALGIPESKTLHDRLDKKAIKQLSIAASYDAVQGSSEYRKEGRLHRARLTGTGSRPDFE